MDKIQVEYLNTPSRPATLHTVARVPCIGEIVYNDETAYVVRNVMLALDPRKGEPVAIVRVAQ